MSKVKIEGNASGTGTLTISAPNTNTDRSLTLPDTAGEIFVGDITSGDLPSGSIVQVVNSRYTTQLSTNSTTHIATGLTASITPTSSSNKILVLLEQSISPVTASTYTWGEIILYRNTGSDTEIGSDRRLHGYLQYAHTRCVINVLDSPSTTSSVTYHTKFRSAAAGSTFDLQHAGLRASSLTLMEVVG